MISINTTTNLPKELIRGRNTIKDYVKTLNSHPGVYRMLDDKNEVLYIGKAKNLKKRVNSYTRIDSLPNRLKRMVKETFKMEFITTNTEIEALLLESNLIKKLKPKYNILLRDDKSYAQIAIQKNHPYPQVKKFRGKSIKNCHLFGPFPSSTSVEKTLISMQKAFLLRSCDDSYFSSRKKPCLQYQIKRCSAPCVKYISEKDYKKSIDLTIKVLKGKNKDIQNILYEKMNTYSQIKDFENAAIYRDKIKALIKIQSDQTINITDLPDVDIFAISEKNGLYCVQVMFYRNNSHYGNKSIFPKNYKDQNACEILTSLIPLFYQSVSPPKKIF